MLNFGKFLAALALGLMLSLSLLMTSSFAASAHTAAPSTRAITASASWWGGWGGWGWDDCCCSCWDSWGWGGWGGWGWW